MNLTIGVKVTLEDMEQMDGAGVYALINMCHWPMWHNLCCTEQMKAMSWKPVSDNMTDSCRLIEGRVEGFIRSQLIHSFIHFVHETHSHEAVQ